jgi:hypothetical protein
VQLTPKRKKANHLKPYGYIKYILDNIAEAGSTPEKLEALLPWNVPTELGAIKMKPLNGWVLI